LGLMALLLRQSGATHDQEEREDETAHRPPSCPS
jgi:hypothetical protein